MLARLPFLRLPSRLAATALLALFCGLAAAQPAAPARAAFGFDDVAREALALSRKPYVPTPVTLPEELKNLSYDGYRDIRFKTERSLWRDANLPFELQFFHLGKFQLQPVSINEITPQGVRHVSFDRADFDYGKNKLSPTNWGDLGFAGFRVHFPINNPQYRDEVIVFLGASYFRAVGKDQHYGLSARGLGIDTVGGSGEEFPRFTTFWLERPAPGATQLVIHALMDSPRAAGAYRFVVRPGSATVVDVQARLFLRANVATLGLAPLTSMFQHGENQPRPDEFRPEVHDSDGLMVAERNGEWLWRPLQNPKNTLVTSFSVRDLGGFGLMQRDRRFESYEDIEAAYERRPSAWVEPIGSWGRGRVELLQLNTPDETNDNIVAYWVPERAPMPGEPLDFAYRLHWQGEQQQRPPGGWVVQSRRGRGFADLGPKETQFVVDFDGPALRALAGDAPVKAVVTAGANGRIVESNAYRNGTNGSWRMTVRADRINTAQPLELRAYLQSGNDALTETWTYIITPE